MLTCDQVVFWLADIIFFFFPFYKVDFSLEVRDYVEENVRTSERTKQRRLSEQLAVTGLIPRQGLFSQNTALLTLSQQNWA